MTLHEILKARTAEAHTAVDAAFSHFDLGDEASYISFLQAHGRVVPTLEAALLSDEGDSRLPRWRPRTPLLEQDLASFGLPLPDPEAPRSYPAPGPDSHPDLDFARMLGFLYVLEGSRIGGAFLQRQVAPRFSSLFLAAKPGPGEWKSFTDTLNSIGVEYDGAWVEQAVAGAHEVFRLYARSAAGSDPDGRADRETDA